MKTIGLIGGTSWTSTIEYYRFMNEEVARRLGGLHSSRLVIFNVEFAELESAMHSGRWNDATAILADAARRLEAARADALVMCSNLIHRMYDPVQGAVRIPVLHLGDAIAAAITARGYRKVALLGAKPTMEEEFYRGRIAARSGADIVIPTPEERQYIDTAIFRRMCCNNYTEADRSAFIAIIAQLKAEGAQAAILACTELPVLLREAPLPLLSSTELHSLYAVDWAMAEQRVAAE